MGKAMGLKEIAIPSSKAEGMIFFASNNKKEEVTNKTTIGSIWPQAEVVNKIKGLKTAQISQVLGHKDYDEVIHRDNLAITKQNLKK